MPNEEINLEGGDPCRQEPCKSKVAAALLAQQEAEQASLLVAALCFDLQFFLNLARIALITVLGFLALWLACLAVNAVPGACTALLAAAMVALLLLLLFLAFMARTYRALRDARRECERKRVAYLNAYLEMLQSCGRECIPFVRISCRC